MDSFHKWGPEETALNKALRSASGGVHEALCDNVDTRRALENLKDLVAAGNLYLDKVKGDKRDRAGSREGIGGSGQGQGKG